MNNKGFAVSGVVYTILIICLASMLILLGTFSDRKTILDKIKSETFQSLNYSIINETIEAPIVTGGSTTLTNSKTYTITEPSSVAGINYYQYYVSNSTDIPAKNVNISGSDSSSVIIVAKTGTYVFFRAISVKGTVGDWSLISDLYVDGDEPVITSLAINGNDLDFIATDNVGIVAYILSTDTVAPISGYTEITSTTSLSETIAIEAIGTYYLYILDEVGNTAKSSAIVIDELSTCEYSPGNVIATYNYTGGSQIFTTPCSGTYKIELWGASGGNVCLDLSGKGAYTSGSINLNESDDLYIYVGEKGSKTIRNVASYNGGGIGYESTYTAAYAINGGFSGGGATDVRYLGTSPSASDLLWNSYLGLNSRLMVAAGGGGRGTNGGTTVSCSVSTIRDGEAGGGLTSPYNADFQESTQTDGGGCTSIYCSSGSFGIGGNSKATYHSSGGGGGGYYGGAAEQGNYLDGYTQGLKPGQGGSSYISGHTGCVAINSSTDRSSIVGCTTGTTNNLCSIHYSNYTFADTTMIDGDGYNWTNVKDTTSSGMPSLDGTTTITGNIGNGYAKITLVSLN